VSPVSRHAWRTLIRRSLRLRAAYRRAAAAVDEPGLRSVLEENAQMLDQLIAEWRAQCRASAEPEGARQRWIDMVRHRVDAWRWRAMPRSDALWIRLLARDEAALLHSFELAQAQASAETAPLLHRQWPRLDAIHRDMRSLAHAVGQ
jgi:hypothetical protein